MSTVFLGNGDGVFITSTSYSATIGENPSTPTFYHGLLISIVNQGVQTDNITSVTYDGLTMRQLSNGTVLKSIGEDVAITTYFLGVGFTNNLVSYKDWY